MDLIKDYNGNANFWEVNPQLIDLGPFKTLYKSDKTKDKRKSSQIAWGVFLYAETSERSLLARIEEEEKLEILKNDFYFDPENEKHAECVEFYRKYYMTPIAKLLTDYENFLQKRVKYITSLDYTLENAEQVDKIASNSKKIWDDYFKIKDQFDKENQKNTFGQGKLSASEKNIL